MLLGQKQIKHVMKKIFATLAIVVATMGLTGCGTAFTASNNLT